MPLDALVPYPAAPANSSVYTLPVVNITFPVTVAYLLSPLDMFATTEVAATPIGSKPVQLKKVLQGMRQDYYDHVYIEPAAFVLQNPVKGVAQEIAIWNAYLATNTLNTINASGDTGLTLSLTPPDVFRGGEYKASETILLEQDAPNNIDASYSFVFDEGIGSLSFIAILAIVFEQKPEVPVTNQLDFKTDIITSANGSEQRIAVLDKPRQTYKVNYGFEEESDFRNLLEVFTFNLGQNFELPIWEEPFYLNAVALAGQSVLSADFSLTDIQVGDNVFVRTTDGSQTDLLKVQAITALAVTVDNNLLSEYPIGAEVYQTRAVNTIKNPKFTREAFATGRMRVDFRVIDRFPLYGTTGSLVTFEGFPVLAERYLADNDIPYSFVNKFEVFDTGNKYVRSSQRLQSGIAQKRRFKIRSRQELQNWKLFFSTVIGQRDMFLAPTWRPDLVLDVAPTENTTQFVIKDTTDYAGIWFASLGHRRVQMLTETDTLYRGVTAVVDNADGTQTVTIDSPFPLNAEDVVITEISFLESVRVARDSIRFTHEHAQSFVEFDIVTINQES